MNEIRTSINKAILNSVTLVGAGVIGRGWIRVFARAGCKVCLYDKDKSQVEKALSWLEDGLNNDVTEEIISREEADLIRGLVSIGKNLDDAVSQAEYIQENCPESLEIKQGVFRLIDQAAKPSAIIASSSSRLNVNDIAAGLPGNVRCMLAHPYNPPYILPAVEVMPTKKTAPEIVKKTIQFLKSVGQKPVLMNYYVSGFLGNRIQAAIVKEAIHLVMKGVADVDAVDTVIREGLGLRYAILGNFGVNHTNADGGLREYYTHYGEGYKAIMNDLDSSTPDFGQEMIQRIAEGAEAMEGRASVSEICRWRDRMIMKIRSLKDANPHP